MIRIGVVGASAASGWARGSHIPALNAVPGFALTAVATTRRASADDAARQFGAAHGFDDYRGLAASPNVDLVVVSVRAPRHREVALEAIANGKAILCEWPVGASLKDTHDIAAAAERAGVRAFAMLQARAAPPAAYVRDLIADGYVGRVLAASLYGAYAYWGETVNFAYSADRRGGANILTIPGGHGLDLMTWLVGEVTDVQGLAARARTQVMASDTGAMTPLTAPDQFAAMGRLKGGDGLFSAHMVGAAPQGEVFQLRIVGDRGELELACDGMPEIAPLRLSASQGGAAPAPLSVPERYVRTPAEVAGPALNVAHLYQLIAQDLSEGTRHAPDLASALGTRRLLDEIERSAAA